jgi:excisionase family DNA binding protein
MSENKKVIKPIELAKQLGIAPQFVYGWMREGKLPSHECTCGHKYLLQDEVNTFLEARAAKKNEAKVVGE